MRLLLALVLFPIGLFVGTLTGSLVIAPAVAILVGVLLRYSKAVRRYFAALDVLANGDINTLARFHYEQDVVECIQHQLDNTVMQINRLRQDAEEDGQTSTLMRDREGDLIRLIKIFDGVQGLYTGPAKTILREGGIDLDRKK